MRPDKFSALAMLLGLTMFSVICGDPLRMSSSWVPMLFKMQQNVYSCSAHIEISSMEQYRKQTENRNMQLIELSKAASHLGGHASNAIRFEFSMEYVWSYSAFWSLSYGRNSWAILLVACSCVHWLYFRVSFVLRVKWIGRNLWLWHILGFVLVLY